MASIDLLTIEEAEAFLQRGLSSLPGDVGEALEALITATSLALEARIGACVIRDVVAETHTVARCRTLLETLLYPVVDVDSLTEDGRILAAAQFSVRSQFGSIVRVSSRAAIPWSTAVDGVVVSYTAGRFASTSVVDDRIKTAAGITLRHMWERHRTLGRQDADFGNPITTQWSYSVPYAALDLVSDLARYPGFA